VDAGRLASVNEATDKALPDEWIGHGSDAVPIDDRGS
jgi:hypothetical protein